MISTALRPMIREPPLVTRLVAVSERRTLAKMRSTPRANTRSSCSSAWNPLTTRMPAEGLGEPAGHLGVDRPALAEDRPDQPERAAREHAEHGQRNHREQSHRRTDAEQQNHRHHRGDRAAYQVHQAGAHQVAHPLDVAPFTRDTSAPVWLLSKNANGSRCM